MQRWAVYESIFCALSHIAKQPYVLELKRPLWVPDLALSEESEALWYHDSDDCGYDVSLNVLQKDEKGNFV